MRADHAMSSVALLEDADTGQFSERDDLPRRRREIQSDLSFASVQEDMHSTALQSELDYLGEENEEEEEEEEDSAGIASNVRLRGDLNILLCGDPG